MAIIDTSLVANVTEYYFSTTGTQLSKTGNGIFYAQNDYANLIVVNIEDGIHNNGTTFINFKPSGKTPYVSHWFYMRPQGTVEKEFNGVVRSFYRFAVRVPTIVLQNNNKDTAIANQITIQQRYGSAFLGNFATLVDLETDYPATETLDNNLSVAYVIEPSNVGFYQVEYNTGTSTYEWVLVETVSQFLQRKQFAVDTITVQPGFANELDVTPIDVETSAYVMQVISEVEQDIVDIYDDLDTKQGYIDDLEQFDTDLQAGTIPLTQITLYNEGGNAVGYFDGTRVIFEYDGVKHEVGENLFFIVKCSASIFEGRVVQYNGLVGASGKIYGKMADPREVNTNPRLILGVATESGTSGQEVRVNWFGNVNMATELSINGTPTATGVVYFDSTSAFVGRLTYDKPEAPNVQIEMGVIEAVGPSGTIINIRPTFGEFLKNLHDVHINGDEADGITIMYNGTNSRYEAYDLKGKVLEIEGSISDIEDGTTPIAYDNSLSDLVATTVKTAIDELDSNVSALETSIIGFEDDVVDLQDQIDDIISGDQVVGKATADASGNVITTTYETKTGATAKVTTHDESETAHLYLRTLIEVLQQEIERLDGRGRSFGEIPYTTAELNAFDAQELDDAFRGYFEDNFPDVGTNWENGYLVYDEGTGDGVAFHEWEYNGSEWVDNGLIGYGKASNTIEGMVKGGNSYVSIVAGVIQVLLSDYATNIGASGSSYTYADIYNALTNRYTKSEVDALINSIIGFIDTLETDKADLSYTNTQLALKVNISDIVDNLTSTDTNKPLSAKQGKALEDNKEALTNKAVDFSVVNDIKYPTTKAVKDLIDTTVGDIETLLGGI